MEHHNCIIDMSKLLVKVHEGLIEKVCKELDAEDRIEEFIKKYVSSEVSRMKPKKDPNMPKKPKSGYMFFCDEQRPHVMKKHKDAKMGQVAKILGDMWKKMDEEMKKPYLDMNENAKEEYNEAMKQYKADS